MHRMGIPPIDQAWLDSQLDEAIAPFVGKLSAGDLGWMREQLVDRLRSDGPLGLLAHRAQPRAVDESAEIFYTREAADAEALGSTFEDEPGAKETG